VTEHSEAVNYDLLTQTGHELRDVGASLSWEALAAFLHNETTDSALIKEVDPEYHLWSTALKTNGILADIYDMLSQIESILVAIGTGQKSKPIKPYPRPGTDEEEGNTRRIGKGALPAVKLEEWFRKKREERNKRNVRND